MDKKSICMQNRFVVQGVGKNAEPLVLAYELQEAEFRIDLRIIDRKELSKEQLNAILSDWTEGENVELPSSTQLVHPDPNADSILPLDIKSDETGKIRSRQNEWAYQLLTNKLWESYIIDLNELKKRSDNLSQYDRALFDDAKSYWERVLEHRKERDISQDRLEKIKEEVNTIFEKLKSFRKLESEQFEQKSAETRQAMLEKIESIKAKLQTNPRYKELAEELKALQAQGRNKMSKSDEALVRKHFDEAFQAINEHRSSYFTNRNTGRIQGLLEVIGKMEQSLNRDKKDMEYYSRKLNSNQVKPLELQLIKVKTNILLESIASKESKIADIRKTLDHLQKGKPEQSNQMADNTTPVSSDAKMKDIPTKTD